MHASYWHLVREPIPVDHEMHYAKDGSLERENIEKAFPNDPYLQLLVQIFITAAHDNEEKDLQWAGVNSAYIEWRASQWWAKEVKSVWYWFLKVFWFQRSFVLYRIDCAMRALLQKGLVEEIPEWDVIEGDDPGLPSNQNMPVYYPTDQLVHLLNASIPPEA